MKSNKNEPCRVFHFELYGKREDKYNFLDDNSISSIEWNELEVKEPGFYLVQKDFTNENTNESFQVEKLFQFYSSGLTTEFDKLVIQDNFKNAEILLNNLKTKSNEEIERIYQLGQKRLDKINNAIKDIKANQATIKTISYRPFDMKFSIYTGKTNGVMGRPRNELMKNFFENNLGIVLGRQGQAVGSMQWNVITITNTIVDCNIFYRGRGTVFPLYIYPESNVQQTINQTSERKPNLNPTIVNQIAKNLGLRFTNEKEDVEDIQENASSVCYANSDEVTEDFKIEMPPLTFAPIDILDYIYAVLHSPTYREKYKEFLKIDFPRVPYPADQFSFWKLVKLGGELRQIHLLECTVVEKFITEYPVEGNNMVGKISFTPYLYMHEIEDENGEFHYPDYLGTVNINDTQYFVDVPTSAWEFYIGGYQPAQKWLKDRKGRELSFEDILHYQKIIVALTETGRIMKEIDKIKIGE